MSQIYQENIYALGQLRVPSTLRATVPVSGAVKLIREQLSHPDFKQWIDEQIRFVKRGGKVERLYVVPNASCLEVEELVEHLNYVSDNNIIVRVVDRSTATSWAFPYLNVDFVTFGESKVSIGQSAGGDGAVVDITEFDVNSEKAKEYVDVFGRLAKQAVLYEQA